jgi:hypothetical protein
VSQQVTRWTSPNFAHRIATHLDAVDAVNQPVENATGDWRIADPLVLWSNRQLRCVEPSGGPGSGCRRSVLALWLGLAPEPGVSPTYVVVPLRFDPSSECVDIGD